MYLQKTYNKHTREGFTLIELMVTISLISLFASIVMVTLSGIKNKAKDAKINEELHSIELVLEEYNTAHSGYPNPNTSSDNMYCIGSSDCMVANFPVTTQFPNSILAKAVSNIASVFPNFGNTEYKDSSGFINKGYVYLSCGADTPTCPNNTARILFPSSDNVRAINVGTFNEVACDLTQCSGDFGYNCGISNRDLCTNYSTTLNACNYDTDGTGTSSGDCSCGQTQHSDCSQYCTDNETEGVCNFDTNGTGQCESTSCLGQRCGPSNNQSCSSFCSNTQSINYDADGTGACTGTWFTTDPQSANSTDQFTQINEGWAGGGYYGNSLPPGHPYFEGAGSCIYISVISSAIQGYSTGNYCTTEIIIDNGGLIESSYPWFTGSTEISGYTYGNSYSWLGTGYYGTSQPYMYYYPTSPVGGVCTYATVSAPYGNGGQTGYYCANNYYPNGNYCYNNSECFSNNCQNNYCHGNAGTGSGCSQNSDCASDICNGGYCAATPTYSCKGTVSYDCSNATDQYSCDNYNYSLCSWSYGSSGGCSGTPNVSCGGTDQSSCTGVNGCSWTEGSGESCNTDYNVYCNGDEYSCGSISGCYWDSDYNYCSGSPNINYNCGTPSSGTCAPGCIYYGGSSSYCNGTPNVSCSGSDQSSCTSVSGCIWSGPTSSSCNRNSSTCSSLSQSVCSNNSVNGCSWSQD
jgi:prepilin-type N-terminal cleavage/methylation domain-containing protein